MKGRTIEVSGKPFELYIPKEMIARRVKEIAREINHDFKGRTVILLCVLKGSFIFAADLIRNLEIDCQVQTITAKSYGSLMQSFGKVEITGLTEDSLPGRDVLIVEDIIDTGNTITALINYLRKFTPKSINVCSLLLKSDIFEKELDIDYLGFKIPPKFVVGYGLDYAEKGRQYPDIYALSDDETN